jgi:hypothetical protein
MTDAQNLRDKRRLPPVANPINSLDSDKESEWFVIWNS